MNFDHHLLANPTDLIGAFADVKAELAQKDKELAQLLAAEKEAKLQAWASSNETSIQGRDRQADHYALGLSVDIIKLKGEMSALERECDVISLLIDSKRR